MTTYQSDMITIDTIKPQVNVTYQNTAKIATLKDGEGAERDYFSKTQTAVVTINEHNFDSNDVKFNIVGKDVAGNMRNISDLISMSSWRTNGDVHSITIAYSGDANYTFDVDYSDLAKNAAEDYAADHFTVDTVAPRITGVSYSSSVLETVLSSVSFGFYNAKMTVTVTAEDDTAGVHQFNYSYLTAAGVSSVNAQLLDQVIGEAGIKYSDGGRTATMTFEIPKMALGSDNQFNGTVKFDATDRSDNKVEQSENKRIVVDNIAPTATVSYNEPVNTQMVFPTMMETSMERLPSMRLTSTQRMFLLWFPVTAVLHRHWPPLGRTAVLIHISAPLPSQTMRTTLSQSIIEISRAIQ